MTRHKPTKISFFGHFGTTNFGNEATLLAIVSRLRLVFPACELCCICSYPENVVATLGIEAVPHTIRSVRIWNREVLLVKRMRMAFLGLCEEPREYVRAWKTLKGTDIFVIPGTGLITDAFALAGWGPYGVFKWSVMARLRGCKVMFVSVGAGPIRSAPGRFLVKSALTLADYRSYRDVPSKEVLESVGLRTGDDRIYPDLVFGLSPRMTPTAANRQGRTVVGLGLMEYAGTYSVANPRPETYEQYLESLAAFVGWLLENDYDVTLLLGDADTWAVDDLSAVLRKRLGSRTAERVTNRPTNSVPELLTQLSATDLVVATRFHNILMGFLLNKPVIAISFHHKCSSLMDVMGLPEYCHDINQMNADTLIEQFQALVENADDVKQKILQRVEAFKLDLDEQYEFLFGAPVDQQHALDVAATAAT
jgi:polysaccharide pyruvyl transferase WcaK-like protein